MEETMTREKLFENVRVISLPHRLDRRKTVSEELSKHRIVFEFFDAVNGHELDYHGRLKKGEEGVRQSHIQLLRQSDDFESVFIFEDDVELSDSFIEELNRALAVLPETCDMLYLGASHHVKPLHVGENLYRVSHSYTAHSVYIPRKNFRLFANTIEANPNLPLDVVYAFMQPKLEAYAIYPHLTWQRNDYSDIQNTFVDYGFLREEFVRWEKPVKRS